MPDLGPRDKFESDFADGLEKEFNRFARELSKLIPGLDSASEALPHDIWMAHDNKLTGVIAPLLHDVFMTHSGEIIDALGFTSVDWGLVDANASEWARRYTYDLVSGIDNTTRQKLQRTIPQYFEQQWTQGQLTEQLMTQPGGFSRSRAETIARTEVTNAASESAQQNAAELRKQGIEMIPYHNTRKDELVCPICGPRDRQVIENQSDFPALHPNCRCWATYELP